MFNVSAKRRHPPEDAGVFGGGRIHLETAPCG